MYVCGELVAYLLCVFDVFSGVSACVLDHGGVFVCSCVALRCGAVRY